jgi:hypothetical protein
MYRNGGIIGVKNITTIDLTSGIWSLKDVLLSNSANIWPGQELNYGLFASNQTCDKFIYASDGSIYGPPFLSLSNGWAAAGNNTISIWTGGSATTTSQKRVYSSEVTSNSVNIGSNKIQHSATGNKSLGVHGGGLFTSPTSSSEPLSTTDIIAYTTESSIPGTNLGSARYSLSAAGNSTVGIFAGGFTDVHVSTSDKYTYSNNTRIGGTALSAAKSSLSGTGTSSTGYFLGGFNATILASVDKYSYSNDSRTSGTSLSPAMRGTAATGNTAFGIIGHGYEGFFNIQTFRKYTYSGDVVSVSTSIVRRAADPDFAAAPGSTPSGFN